jgi:ribonuclease HI
LEDNASFGKLWRAMFRPAPLVQDEIDATMKSLGLEVGKYSATHARVRHPGRFDDYVPGKDGSEADVSGLPWHGPNKEMALASATRALRCTQWISKFTEEPIYFYSDSEDLVQQLLEEQNEIKMGTKTLLAKDDETKADRKRQSVLKRTKLAARDVSKFPTAHLDRQLGLPAEAYVSTFVDLYIAASARCIAFGVGNFGYLAAKVSGTDCFVLYEGQKSRGQARMWNQQHGGALKCPLK